MPLIHGKSDASFAKNVATEIRAGRPQKQAVAIAYSEKRAAQHKKMGHGGRVEDCPHCYADGGEVKDSSPAIDPEKAKQMQAGATQSGWQPGQWVQNIKEGLGMADGGVMKCPGKSCKGCSDAQCYAKGGLISGNEKGVHRADSDDDSGGQSWMGTLVRRGETEGAKKVAIDKRRENRDITNENEHDRTNLAEGGEVEGPEMSDDEMDAALGDAACGELLDAIEKKDKAAILESIRALVLSVR
jgi:hypothetical protein